MPRSVTTLIAFENTSLASMKLVFTLVVSKVSLERAPSELAPITASSLTTVRTFSMRVTPCSTALLSASLGTAPPSRTSRL